MNKSKTRCKLISIVFIVALTFAIFFPSASNSQAASDPIAKGKTNTKAVILRAGPSTSTKKLKILKKNTKFNVYQEVFKTNNKSDSKNKWYKVKVGKKSGYIRSDLVKITKYSSSSAWTSDELNFRAGAGTSMKKKGALRKGSKIALVLPAIDSSGKTKWYKIKKGSSYYYVCANWVTKKAPKKASKSTSKTKPASTSASSSSSNSASAKSTVTSVPAQSKYAKEVADKACKWAVKIANDNSFHYGNGKHSHHNGCYFCGTQAYSKRKYVVQWEKTYCCNPFVTAAYAHGGNEPKMLSLCQNGKSWMAPQFKKSVRFYSLGHPKKADLKRGDILCADAHVAMYLGDGKLVEAATTDNGKPGSSSWNSSIRVTNLTDKRYKSFNAGVFRYIGTK